MHLSHHLTEKITLYIASLARGAIPEMVTAVVLGTCIATLFPPAIAIMDVPWDESIAGFLHMHMLR
jgi:urea transporter